jgi:hypothetical protein
MSVPSRNWVRSAKNPGKGAIWSEAKKQTMVKVIFLQRWVHRSRPSKIQHLVFTYGIWVRFAKSRGAG